MYSKLHLVLIVLATVVIVTLILLSPLVPGYWFTDIQTIDSDFDGLLSGKQMEPGESGLSEGAREKNIALLMVHGIGRHCIGYSDGLVSGIAKQMGHASEIAGKESSAIKDCNAELVDFNEFDGEQDRVCEGIHNEQAGDQDCRRLRLTVRRSDPKTGQEKDEPFFAGYLRTRNYRLASIASQAPVNLQLYELTWDAATRWAKSTYVVYPDSEFDDSRETVNRNIKRQIINESIADAVLYLGDYRPFMQYPLLMAFCKMVSDIAPGEPSDNTYDFKCDFKDIEDRLQKRSDDESEIVIITHSLGTRMVFDALGMIASDSFPELFMAQLQSKGVVFKEEYSEDDFRAAEGIRDVFQQRTSKIFNLANQVPLLELGVVDRPFHYGLGNDDLGEGFAEFHEGRGSGSNKQAPLQLVAFTDPNDLLSYNLKCWYFLRVLKFHDMARDEQERDPRFYRKWFKSCKLPNLNEADQQKLADLWGYTRKSIRLTDVTVDLSGLEYPYLFDDPDGAHSAFFDDELIHQLIACGGTKDNSEANVCAVHAD